jgi:hypothetical protein
MAAARRPTSFPCHPRAVYRLVVSLGFALLFTGITIRLAFGGLDASFVVAAIIALVMWALALRAWQRL